MFGKLVVGLATLVLAWGTAAYAAECDEGTKLGDDCRGITYEGCCDGNITMWCGNHQGDTGPLCALDCAAGDTPSQCGWKNLPEYNVAFYGCGGNGPDPSGKNPIDCGWKCTPSCDGKQCGSDGCLGSCGKCPDGQYCNAEFKCAECTCAGKECGPDECGNPCGTCTGGKSCLNGKCVDTPKECVADRPDGCADCGCKACTCEKDEYCCDKGWDFLCVQECHELCGGPECGCLPDCEGKECGDDGCGGTCGACTAQGAVCYKGKCCIPSCEGKECGDDGCGGKCGAPEGCGDGKFCNDQGKCEACSCGDKTCGFDQCDNPCGTNEGKCGDGEYCDSTGHCKPCSCDGKTCGDDGCGKPCGTCPAGKGCTKDGQCVDVPAGCYATDGVKGCGGCACEQCVCDLDDYCCNTEWDFMCVKSCIDDCNMQCPEDVCMPNCSGSVCGDDGCNGTCGSCKEGEYCDDGQCAKCTCEGKECGDDGCGNTCGTCPAGKICNKGKCADDPCHGIPMEGCCDGNILKYCYGGLQTQDCGSKGCGWSASDGWYDCGGSGADPNGEFPLQCPECTWGSCEGKECGDDGCGKSCGTCPAGKSCSEGKCVGAYPEACLGEKTPSADSCDGIVTSFEGCCDSKNRVVWCDQGKLFCLDCATTDNPTCGWGSDQQAYYICGGSGADPSGKNPLECPEQQCTPNCDGQECGDGGCPGSAACGTCPSGKECKDGKCVEACVPQCEGKECGDDGCGKSCGVCDAGKECKDGKCVEACIPNCGGKQCGDDGCGHSCGTCPAGQACTPGGKCEAVTTETTTQPDVPKTDTGAKPDAPAQDAAVADQTTGGGGGGGGGCTAGAGLGATPLALLLSSLAFALRRRRD